MRENLPKLLLNLPQTSFALILAAILLSLYPRKLPENLFSISMPPSANIDIQRNLSRIFSHFYEKKTIEILFYCASKVGKNS